MSLGEFVSQLSLDDLYARKEVMIPAVLEKYIFLFVLCMYKSCTKNSFKHFVQVMGISTRIRIPSVCRFKIWVRVNKSHPSTFEVCFVPEGNQGIVKCPSVRKRNGVVCSQTMQPHHNLENKINYRKVIMKFICKISVK